MFGQKWSHTWEDSYKYLPAASPGSRTCLQQLFPHLALSGQCIVDCQQCTVGSGPLAGLDVCMCQ